MSALRRAALLALLVACSEPSEPATPTAPEPATATESEGEREDEAGTGAATETGAATATATESDTESESESEGDGESEAASVASDHRLSLTHAAYPPTVGAPDVLVHVPAGALRRGPHHVVFFLHGYSGCVEVLAAETEAPCRPGERALPGFGVVAAHDAAGTDTVLVLPQLAWMERDGSPGRLARRGEARAMIDEALAGAGLEGGLASVTLAAHSAAFESAIAVLRSGGLDDVLRHVILLDALYSGGPAFLGWARGGTTEAPRTLVSIVTGGTPRVRTEALVPAARRALGPALAAFPEAGVGALAAIDAPARALFVHVRGAHGDVPRRWLGPVLAALGLPRRPTE